MSNTKTDIEVYLNRLKKAVNETKQKMAKTALRELIIASPVRTGNYIKSHKVGINTQVMHHEPVNFQWHEPMPEAMALALKQALFTELAAETLEADFDDFIIISNSIPYADRVEFIGWMLTPAYHPFGKAKLALKSGKYLLTAFTNAPTTRKESSAKIRDFLTGKRSEGAKRT